MDRTHAGHYGAQVAHAGLVASVAIGLGSMDAPVPATIGLMEMSWKYLQPVRVGDSIRSRWRLARKRPLEGKPWGVVVWQVEVENQAGVKVAQGEVTRMVASSGAPRAAALRPQPLEAGSESVAEAAAATGARRRRRRGGRGSGSAGGQVAETVFDEPTPEPETADVPSAARRSRRRRGRGGGGGSGAAAASSGEPERAPAPAPPAAPAAGSAAPSARGGLGGVLRRLRGGG